MGVKAILWALVGAVLVCAAPVATWWLVGDLSTVPLSENPDYAFRPLDIASGTARVAGVLSMSVFLLGLVVVTVATVARSFRPQWLPVLAPLIVAGMMIGYGWRIATAGVIGANIGAGLVIFLGTPIVVVLIAWTVGWSVHLVRRARQVTGSL